MDLTADWTLQKKKTSDLRNTSVGTTQTEAPRERKDQTM